MRDVEVVGSLAGGMRHNEWRIDDYSRQDETNQRMALYPSAWYNIAGRDSPFVESGSV